MLAYLSNVCRMNGYLILGNLRWHKHQLSSECEERPTPKGKEPRELGYLKGRESMSNAVGIRGLGTYLFNSFNRAELLKN